MKELAAEYREKLVEQVVELDDDAMMAYLDVSGRRAFVPAQNIVPRAVRAAPALPPAGCHDGPPGRERLTGCCAPPPVPSLLACLPACLMCLPAELPGTVRCGCRPACLLSMASLPHLCCCCAGRAAGRGHHQAPAAQGHHRGQVCAHVLRHRVQEQGRAGGCWPALWGGRVRCAGVAGLLAAGAARQWCAAAAAAPAGPLTPAPPLSSLPTTSPCWTPWSTTCRRPPTCPTCAAPPWTTPSRCAAGKGAGGRGC